jgi:hypothetical protein
MSFGNLVPDRPKTGSEQELALEVVSRQVQALSRQPLQNVGLAIQNKLIQTATNHVRTPRDIN